jgi:hypothetical protein
MLEFYKNRCMLFFTKIKKTEELEQERLKLWNDYQTYLKVEKSDELKTYLALKEKVESKPFTQKKKEVEGLKYKGSPEENLEKQFSKLSRNKKLTSFFSTKTSNDLLRYNEIEKNGSISRLNELEKYVKSGQYNAEQKAFSQKKKADKNNNEIWEQSPAFEKFKTYNELKSSTDTVFYYRFKKSSGYQNYLNIDGSTLLNQFKDIKAETGSEKFQSRKAYLLDTKRYEKTDDYKALTAFMKLDSDPEIKLYLSYNETDAFKFFREWKLTFEENFYNLDPKVWSFITPIAEKGPGKNFSIKNQLQCFNNNKNFDVDNNLLTLEAKKEDIEGLYWDEKYGFVPKTFNYTSGVTHTLNHFMQEYGHYEIKLKASRIKGVVSSVSLFAAEEETCIRLFTSNGNEMNGGLVTTDQHGHRFNAVKFKTPLKGYLIVTLNWNTERLEWSINDKVVGRITENIPHAALGIRIETEVLKANNNLPHRLDIDWIKCYKKNV